jgi:carbon storage regulator
MLVLTRRIGEEIVIADNIRVKVVAVRGPKIRVGITAPLSVPVVRLELLARGSKGGGSPTDRRIGKSPGREGPWTEPVS